MKRAGVYILRTILVLGLLEILLGASQWLQKGSQEWINRRALRSHSAVTLLFAGGCHLKPRIGEKVASLLSERYGKEKITFRSVTKSSPMTDTAGILEKLPEYLEAYRPDVVLLMTGREETGNAVILKKPKDSGSLDAALSRDADNRSSFFLEKSNLYRFLKILIQKLQENWMQGRPGKESDFMQRLLQQQDSDRQEQVRKYEHALKQNSEDEEAAFQLAGLYAAGGDYQKAETLYLKVLSLNPKHLEARYALGVLYVKEGQAGEALRVAAPLLEDDPDKGKAQTALGMIAVGQRNIPAAVAYFKEALRANPDNAPAHAMLALIAEWGGKYAESQAHYEYAFAVAPEDSYTSLGLGSIYLRQKRYHEAIDFYLRQIARQPENPRFWGALAMAYLYLGQKDLAQENLARSDDLWRRQYDPGISLPYNRIKELVRGKGLPLVCLQYPHRRVEPLKAMLRPYDDKVLFVDTGLRFREAIFREGYDRYFGDSFDGDSGHMTPAGDELLVDGIFETLSQQYFDPLLGAPDQE